MNIITDNYNDFINGQILYLRSYESCSKQMSFSLRHENQESVFAYCSLKANNLLQQGNGCQIMEFNNNNNYANERFFDSIVYRVEEYEKNKFNYLWFYTSDIDVQKANELFQHLEGFQYIAEYKAYIKMI